jgi:hypothetical protein
MTTEHVLGHLAQRFAISEENIATEALIWIVRQSFAARVALAGLASSVGAVLPDDLNYVGQVGNADTGRPDVVGFDDSGVERILIEAKFAAQLTAHQPMGYIERLPEDAPGLLLVVAPSVRMSSLWVELVSALPKDLPGSAIIPSADLDVPVARIAVGGCRVLAIISWRHLILTVLNALNHSGEILLAQDAEQLLALTEVMDDSAYAPVRPGDYGPRSARQIQQLQVLIDDARTTVLQGSLIEKAGNSSHGRIFYGWYLRSIATQKQLWFGFLPRAWDRYAMSPLWIHVDVTDYWSHQRLSHAVVSLNLPGAPGVFDDGPNFLIPLVIPHFASKNEAVDSLVRQLETVAEAINAAAPAAAKAVANEQADQPNPDEALSGSGQTI